MQSHDVKARIGHTNFINFIDDYTHYSHVYLISHMSEALRSLENYLTEVETKLERKVKTLQTNCRREYLSDQFMELYSQRGIVRQLTMPYILQQNGVAKRQNRTLFNKIRSTMKLAGLLIPIREMRS